VDRTGRGSCEEPSHSESEDKHKEVTPAKINKHPRQEEFKGESEDNHDEVTPAAGQKKRKRLPNLSPSEILSTGHKRWQAHAPSEVHII
jgi:hypothetical protein